ncbi:MAG: type IX secretion system membrane protein PorP/SprF [Bacteroidia bacterium]|nr:type IX secretion system membrane protein PorP/SprF [Bacteroidia bacterium]
MKRIIFISALLVILWTDGMFAQQLPQYTQYIFNEYIINPAVAGRDDYFQAKANYRYQWAGIVDAPRTYILSLYGPHKTKDMGYGGYVFNDVTGPTSRTGINFSYSYILKLSDSLKLSLSLAAGFLQYKIDGTKINMLDIQDPSIQNRIYTALVPDATFGAYLYAPKYFFGLSAQQLLNNKLDLYTGDNGMNRVKNHFFAYGGYKYAINSDFDVEPSLLLKVMMPVPPQLDITVKGAYKKMVWLGASFRTSDAIGLMAGYNYQNQIYFGYSYDISTSSIKKYNSGTHEFMITARFNKIKNFSKPLLK